MRLLSNLHVKGKPAVLPYREIRSQSHYFIYRPRTYVRGIYIYTICYSGDQIMKNEMGGTCLDSREKWKILMGRPEGTRPIRKPKRRWENNIKMDFQEVGWKGMDWIAPNHDTDSWRALVNAVMKFKYLHCPSNYITYVKFNTYLLHSTITCWVMLR